MSKRPGINATMPPVVSTALRRLGEDLSIARKRRRESQRDWADRLNVSVPTVIRMEKGDATVSMAVYATALWLMGRAQALAEIATPATDTGALEQDIRTARKRGTPRGRLVHDEEPT
jgi:DNA-binding XRE family transcriptional regulator